MRDRGRLCIRGAHRAARASGGARLVESGVELRACRTLIGGGRCRRRRGGGAALRRGRRQQARLRRLGWRSGGGARRRRCGRRRWGRRPRLWGGRRGGPTDSVLGQEGARGGERGFGRRMLVEVSAPHCARHSVGRQRRASERGRWDVPPVATVPHPHVLSVPLRSLTLPHKVRQWAWLAKQRTDRASSATILTTRRQPPY